MRFTVEQGGSCYESEAEVEVGDLVVAMYGQAYPKPIVTKVTSLESDYDGPCRRPIVIVRGGEVVASGR